MKRKKTNIPTLVVGVVHDLRQFATHFSRLIDPPLPSLTCHSSPAPHPFLSIIHVNSADGRKVELKSWTLKVGIIMRKFKLAVLR